MNKCLIYESINALENPFKIELMERIFEILAPLSSKYPCKLSC